MKRAQQRGAVLVVTLVMLVVLTIFVVSAVNTSTVNLKIVGNWQRENEMETNVQQAIERVLSSSALFDAPATVTETVNQVAVPVQAPRCMKIEIAKAMDGSALYDLNQNLALQDSKWVVEASAEDASGATVNVTQGIKMTVLSGAPCP